MPRATPEWVGKTDNAAIPPRVRLRVFERFKGLCQTCFRKIGPADKWECDHEQALINGGANAESNLTVRCLWCHRIKTNLDVAAKARTASIRRRHYGVDEPSPWAKRYARAKAEGYNPWTRSKD